MPRTDEGQIRAAAVQHGIPCITTIEGAETVVMAIKALRSEDLQVESLQSLFADQPVTWRINRRRDALERAGLSGIRE